MHLHIHVHFKPFHLPEEVKHFYELALIRNTLVLTFGLFAPIFLFTNFGIEAVLVYYLVLAFFARVLEKPLFVFVLKKYGLELALYLSIVLLFLASIVFSLVSGGTLNIYWILVAAILQGMSLALYWDSYHTAFGLFGMKREKIQELAMLEILNAVLAITLPIFSAIFIAILGYHAFFTVVSILAFFGAGYLLKHFDKKTRVTFSLRNIFTPKRWWLWTLEGAIIGLTWMVPIFLYQNLGGIVNFGATRSAAALLGALSSLWLARRYDHGSHLGLAAVGYFLQGLLIILVAELPGALSASAEIIRTIAAYLTIGIYTIVYEISRRYPEELIGRNMYIGVGNGIAFVILIALLPYLRLTFPILALFFSAILALGISRVLAEIKERTSST